LKWILLVSAKVWQRPKHAQFPELAKGCAANAQKLAYLFNIKD
jgi:hypothetical protein